MENILEAYNEVCYNTKNKKKVRNYRENKCIYISRIYNILKNREYEVGEYNVFTIYEPKERRIVSQSLQDKVINHLVSRQILYPALIPCLINENVASIKNKGNKYGVELANRFHNKCKIKYGEYYILKCDISKFFASINKDKLKEKVTRKIKDKEALEIVFKIIDSEEQGLGIGNMTSQILAIFYLNNLDHYIKEDLILNRKTRIYKNTNNFIFLGRNKYGKYAKYREVKRKLKKKRYLYENNKITLMSYTSSLICYKNLIKL